MKNKNSNKTSLGTTLAKLRHQDYEVRMRAVEKLGTLLSGEKAPPDLIAMLEDKDELVRIAAAESLGQIGDSKVLPDLWKKINDSSPLVRCYVAQAIGELGEAGDAEKLEKKLKQERNESSRLGYYEALYRLGRDSYLFSVISLLKSRDYRVRCAAANTLADVQDDRYLAQLVLNILREVLSQEPTVAAKSSLTSAIKFVSQHIKKLNRRSVKSE